MSRDKKIVFMNTDERLLKYRVSSYQTCRSRLAYGEIIGYMLREFIVFGRCKFLLGFFVFLFKYIFKFNKLTK